MGYSGVFVFGDSLVDAGNALKLAQWYGTLTLSDLPDGAPSAGRGYFAGRFSDGYAFTDLVSNKYIGVPTKPVFPYFYEDPWLGIKVAPLASDPSGNNLNFAYGGAQIRQGKEVVPDLDGQTDAFRHAVDGEADPTALYMVTIGGNDVRSLVPSGSAFKTQAEATVTLQKAALRFHEELEQLIAIGVQNLVVTGVPNVGIIPAYDTDGSGALSSDELARSQQATLYSEQLDTMLQQQLTLLRAEYPSASITYVSLTDATDHNIALLEALHGRPIDTVADPELLFFDQIHPNAQAHALLAAYIIDTMNGAVSNDRLPLTAPDYRTNGIIAVKGEVDKLVVSLAANSTYTFEMLGISALGTAGTLADPSLRVWGPGGALAGADDDGGIGLDSSFTFTTTTAGDYVVDLRSVGSITGGYEFRAAGDAQGNNVYTVTHTDALILERTEEGSDTVRSSVSYSLASGVSIETLRTTNDRATTAINLTGNEFSQTIVGNAGANRIDGKAGNDTLSGGAGKDTFVFTTALNSTTNVDVIRDFSVPADTVWLDDAVFFGLAPGALTSGAFARGVSATQADDRIIYDSVTGKLYFDPDGSGSAAQVQFAALSPNLALASTDFVIG